MINPLELLILGRRFPLRNIWWTRETSGNPSTFPVFEKVEGFLGIKKERISKIEILFGAKLNHSKGALKDARRGLEIVSRNFLIYACNRPLCDPQSSREKDLHDLIDDEITAVLVPSSLLGTMRKLESIAKLERET